MGRGRPLTAREKPQDEGTLRRDRPQYEVERGAETLLQTHPTEEGGERFQAGDAFKATISLSGAGFLLISPPRIF
jgi:hypothetical protein